MKTRVSLKYFVTDCSLDKGSSSDLRVMIMLIRKLTLANFLTRFVRVTKGWFFESYCHIIKLILFV